VRRCQRRRAAAFVGGEGSPVVAGVAEEVLQLGRGEEVRKLQEIPGIGSSGRSSPGRGGRRRRSAEFREGEAGSGGRRRRSGCGEWRGGSSTRERGRRGGERIDFRTEENARRSALGGSAAERGKGEGRGGSRAWECHAARGGSRGPVPTGGRRRQQPVRGAGGRRAPRARTLGRSEAARERADRWAGTVTAAVSLTGGAGLSAARGERGAGASARARVGRPERRKEIGPPDCTVPFWNCLNYFE
jgi:hypothetical protein